MITIHTGKFTYECKDYDAVLETIRRENINLDDARVSFRVSLLPATAFIGIADYVRDKGGKVL